MRPIKKSLYRLYQKHGALTFALGLTPLMPQFVELHTLAYLSLVQRVAGSVEGSHHPIRILFGSRGTNVYQRFLDQHPRPITKSSIARAFIDKKNPNEGIKQASRLFFDRRYRQNIHADLIRAQTITFLFEVFTTYRDQKHQNFRSRLCHLLINHAYIDQSPSSLVAFVDLATKLVATNRHRLQQKKNYLETKNLARLEAQTKAKLLGNAGIYSHHIHRVIPLSTPPQILLNEQDENTLLTTLTELSSSSKPEVAEQARESLRLITDQTHPTLLN